MRVDNECPDCGLFMDCWCCTKLVITNRLGDNYGVFVSCDAGKFPNNTTFVSECDMHQFLSRARTCDSWEWDK